MAGLKMYLESGQFQPAADAFALLLQEFPASTRRLEASFGEAQARFKLRQWPRVTALLQKPDGDFQKISLTRTNNDDLVVRGLRTSGTEQLALLDALREEFSRIGATHISGRLSELIDAVRADDPSACRKLLGLQASLRVFDRIMTLEAAETSLKLLGQEVEDVESDDDLEDDGDDDA